MMLCFAVFGVARAQVTIGDLETAGNDTYLPMNSLYEYSYSQQIYTADEIGTAGTINAITIWMYGNANLYTIPFDIYMVETDKESFTSTTDWESVTSGDIVYSGSVTVHNTEAEAYTFELATPFSYSGTGNLLIAFDNNCGQWRSGLTGKVFTATDNVTRSIYVRQDSNDYDPTNMSGVTATADPRAMRNVIEIDITPGGGPSCARPSGLAINYTGGTTAEVSWNSDATAWNIDVNGTVTAITTNPYTLTNLELGTAYTVKVQANCGGGDLSDWSSAKSFTTDLCLPENMCEITITLTDAYGDGGGNIKVVDVLTNEVLGSFTNSGESTTYTLAVCDGRELNFVYASTDNWSYENGWVITDINNEIISEHVGCTTSGSCDAPTNGVIANYTVNCTPATCPKPHDLTVSYTGGTEATISWTSDATAWNMRVNGVDVNGVITNPYTLTGLELSTTYEVEVQANCGADGESEWAGPVSFTTDACMPEDLIVVNYALTDSYGDGWNGNAILVVDENCNIVNQLTIESGNSASGTLRVCGSYLQFLWYKGSYPTETSWVFTDNAGNVLFEGAGSADMATLDVLYTIDNNPYSAPTDVAASEVGPRSAKLSWTETGTATAWQIKLTAGDDEEGTIIDANSNPFVITGLTPETEYFAQVRATGANGTSIWTCIGADFTTDVACPKPTNLSVTAYPFTADVTWNGFADAYDLEWALMPATESKDALWLQYDNGTYDGGIGNSTANTWTWGVMYPASMLAGNGLLSKVSIYENSTYNTADITINVYTGGDTAPETLVYTETITPEAGDAFHEIILAEPVTFDPTQNLWITLTEYGTYVLSYCQNGDNANNDWVLNGSTWAHIGDLAATLAGDTWMIRGYVEPAYDPSTLVWNPVSGVTSPYTIEGLQPETTYVVRVKALCGGEDGESGWTTVSFTTPSACDMPIDLAANDITYNSAKLSWTGYQESYNVRYRRTPYVATTYFSEDFDEGLPATWTTIDNDTTTVGNWIALSEISNVYSYYTSPLTGWAHSGDDAVASASYVNGVGAVATDNYLVTPQVTFNGKLRFYVTSEYSDPDTYEVLLSTTGNSISDFNVTLQAMGPATYGAWDEVIIDLSDYAGQQGYIAIHHVATDKYWLVIDDFGMYDFVNEDWTNVTATENTYTATGLTPEAEYEWQVQGINRECDGGLTEWSEIQTFTTLEQTLTIDFVAGWNWFSTYVEEADSYELLQSLLTALGENGLYIESNDYEYLEYLDGEWLGDLMEITPDKMYLIQVGTDCTISLNGAVVNPAVVEVTINPGWNWVGYPCNVEMTLGEALANFEAEDEDEIESMEDYAMYLEGEWLGFETQETLKPGQGFLYNSMSSDVKTLVFAAPSAKAKAANPTVKPAVKPAVKPNAIPQGAAKTKAVQTIDIQLPAKK